jgi:hypothetical protein
VSQSFNSSIATVRFDAWVKKQSLLRPPLDDRLEGRHDLREVGGAVEDHDPNPPALEPVEDPADVRE